MVTQQILVLFFQVRVLVVQRKTSLIPREVFSYLSVCEALCRFFWGTRSRVSGEKSLGRSKEYTLLRPNDSGDGSRLFLFVCLFVYSSDFLADQT